MADDLLAAFEAEIADLPEGEGGEEGDAAAKEKEKEKEQQPAPEKPTAPAPPAAKPVVRQIVAVSAKPTLSAAVAEALADGGSASRKRKAGPVYPLDEERQGGDDEEAGGEGHAQEDEKNIAKKKKKHFRTAAGKTWLDETLNDWPEGDFRLWVGKLGKEVNDEVLANTFKDYPTFNMARIIRNKGSGESKGYGFVSFQDPMAMVKAMREQQGKFCGQRRMMIKGIKDQYRDKSLVKKKAKNDAKARSKMGLY